MISTNKKVKDEIISQSQGLCGAGQKGRKQTIIKKTNVIIQ